MQNAQLSRKSGWVERQQAMSHTSSSLRGAAQFVMTTAVAITYFAKAVICCSNLTLEFRT
jgi:hypothetical protein